jgi:DNA-binding transcriptional LysR family regulator
MDWNDLRYVLTLSRASTLAAAARRLNVNQTTVARRLDAIQDALGARLFERVDGAFHPTKAGEAAIAHAARVEQDVANLERGIRNVDHVVSGLVRLTAVPMLINRLIVPALPELQTRHPGLRIDLIADSRNASLTRREADIALRLARPETGRSVLARRLGQLDYAVYGASARLPWITYEEGLAHLPQARWIETASRGEAMAPWAVSDAETLLQAVRVGLGKSLLACFVGDSVTGLRRLSGKPVLSREIWLLTHAELRRQARMTAVVDWLGDLVKMRLRPKAASR